MFTVIVWLVVGVIGSAVLLQYVHRKSPKTRLNILGCALIIAALIYVAFAAYAINLKWVGIELVGVFIYGCFFAVAKQKGLIYLAIGWILHPVWDFVLHLYGAGHEFAPQWYAIMCISFDVTVAVYILIQARVENRVNAR
ncbi:DUF6010 family protein [Vibrio sonorensis]|uniref:DUF6010 family protein n=1 Tax=Vibrio sonorensis TaxID=1004316 RepID=UPI0008DABEE3|nr:DUF6010 family protein [Vibrio sonorensis]